MQNFDGVSIFGQWTQNVNQILGKFVGGTVEGSKDGTCLEFSCEVYFVDLREPIEDARG